MQNAKLKHCLLKLKHCLLIGLVGAVAAVAAVSGQAPADCSASGGVQFVCGQNGPEDLVVIPGSQWVVASSYGGSGGINLIRVSDHMSMSAYPGAAPKDRLDAKTYKACPGPPDKAKFLTHGLSLLAGRNGQHKLFVVAHGARESVEVFDVDAKSATPTLTWIGCAIAPDPIGLNSVRGLPDGSFFATNFLPRGADINALREGGKNGELWEWHTASGWQKVAGSETSGANGIEISEDGHWFYVAAWGSQSFYRLSRGQAKPTRDEIPLGFRVDNIRWARDGSILAAGQGGTTEAPTTNIVEVDPKTMKVREIVKSPNVGAFGGGTVAVEIEKTLWVGSFRGDRIAIFKRP